MNATGRRETNFDFMGCVDSQTQLEMTWSVLQECRSVGMVVLHTTVARNGGPKTHNTRNVGPTRPLFPVTLVRGGPTKLKMIGPPSLRTSIPITCPMAGLRSYTKTYITSNSDP